jgi:hypothetical protein
MLLAGCKWVAKSVSTLQAAARKEQARMTTEQARKIKHKAIPEWAEGLYYNGGLYSEVLVYHDDEAIYLEHKGRDSGVVRFTFEMIEGLKIVEDEIEVPTNSTQ